MADNNPNGTNAISKNLLPNYYNTESNKKFLQATVDQLVQPGAVKKVNGFIGRKTAKSAKGSDVYLKAADTVRQDYQLEPGFTVSDSLGNTTFFKDYIDYINQLRVFGSNVDNHARLNLQEFYSWDPHIDWDKFVNFQNYYWLPFGPATIKIFGQQLAVTSTYTVKLELEGSDYQYIFTPDGLTPNPVLKLYRGQTYTFNISSLGNPLSFKTSRSLGVTDRYVISGIDNYGVENGTITFTVPNNAPNLLYYQSETDMNVGGVVEIFDITEATFIDVSKDILGKQSYILPNGTPLSNGMKVSFGGNVTPAKFATSEFYVEGVGSAIKLINKDILEIAATYTITEAVYFDSVPFDTQPFSDSTGFAGTKDYLLINRASNDHNPWSRYNRWFHKDVIETSAKHNGRAPSLDQDARATRPIIEFNANLKLFNFGTTAVDDVDVIDTFTIDVFSTIEGSAGYNVDGTPLSQGQLILFTADTDRLVKNNIYKVTFVNIQGFRQIHLVPHAEPSLNQVVLIKQGTRNKGQMYWFNGSTWKLSQQKSNINQSPLFDIVNDDKISYGDTDVYPGSTFRGTAIFLYKISTSSTIDPTLGFGLTYKNINNVGDIVFNFTLATDTFEYKLPTTTALTSVSIKKGYLISQDYAGNLLYQNGWQKCIATTLQAGIRVYKDSKLTNTFPIDIFNDNSELNDLVVKIYINGIKLPSSDWSLVDTPRYKTVKLKNSITSSDVLTIKTYTSQPINENGYYEIPVNLQNNPMNNEVGDFTLGEVIDHVGSIVDNLTNFSGTYPGNSNLRDLGNISPYGTKFVQHSGPASLSTYHITSEINNIVRAIEKNREDYNNFKRNFISIASNLGVDTDPVTQVDLILDKINKDKPKEFPYYFSDMVPYGSYSTTTIKVVDYRIKTYPLTNVFNLDVLSNKAVGVYLNGLTGSQLLYGLDYTFNSQGFIELTNAVNLKNNDLITIREYDNTDGSFVPETPTKLGMWPKFTPKIYLDTTLINPVNLIQGHDGSLTAAYNDYRDAIILELEKRIFNNIKVKYNTEIFDIADIIPSFNRPNDYSLDEFNLVLAPSFYKWTSLIDRDFSKPLKYDVNNSFTYNYAGHSGPTGYTVPGYWRGIYRYLLDTDRPNICPWEMLGFSQEPAWWVDTYGPSPYTCDNAVMWKDISDGVIRQPDTAPIYVKKYAKSFLTKHIPVDDSGNLISPAQSGLATGTVTFATDSDYVFGDVGPVEAAWRRSSYFPFSIILASMLLTPAKTFGLLLDRSRIVRNLAGQLVYSETGLRITPADVVIPSISVSKDRIQTAGIINYLTNYILSDNLKSYSSYQYDLMNISPRISHRIGAFTSKEKFNLLLDSKTYASSSSVFVPQENYKIILNSSSPVKKITYSGIIITKVSDGFEIKGYSQTQPFFKYYQYTQSGITINVGGISEKFNTWTPQETYSAGSIIKLNQNYYRVLRTHTTTNNFESLNYQSIPSLPIVGGRSATFRKTWKRTNALIAPYGTRFKTVQDVVDFILGYGEYLKDQGFIFDEYNKNLGTVTNWETSAKEFMFWTTQNWSTGEDKWTNWIPNVLIPFNSIVKYNGDYYRANSNIQPSAIFDVNNFVKLDNLSTVGSGVISLSPSADKITFKTTLSIVDDISNPFNGYEVVKVDGTPLDPHFINSYREDNSVSYSSTTNDGIYGASFYLVQKEQVVILDNTTLFNDTIYNPESGYRQERIKVAGYVSVGWYGGFDAPGFIFDEARIEEWSSWSDYNLGDIVKYKQFYYSAKTFLQGQALFNSSEWVKLDKPPSAGLLPNWTYKAGQFTDFYSLDSDNFDSMQQKVAQHLIGYQKRSYLDNIIKDDVSEFKFYQGMIREKGTQNSLNKLFDVLSSENKESLGFYEEWAIRLGQYGASGSFENIEFVLDEAQFKINPQGFYLVQQPDFNALDYIIRQTPNSVYLKPLGYNNNPWPILKNYQSYLRSAGYVREADVFITIKQISDIANYDVETFNNGSYIWCTFEGISWNVYRFTDVNFKVTNVSYDQNILTITLKDVVTLPVGTWIGISQTTILNGFYQITSVKLNTFTVSADIPGWSNPFNENARIIVYALLSQRADSIDNIDDIIPRKLTSGEKLWTDNSGDGTWATWTYDPVYTKLLLTNTNPDSQLNYGRSVSINANGNILGISTSNGDIITWDKASPKTPWIQRQYITKPVVTNHAMDSSLYATVATFSNDGTWLVTGSPSVGYVHTRYKGTYNVFSTYNINDIVSNGSLYFYRALQDLIPGRVPPTGKTASIYWESIPYIPVEETGTASSLNAQGVVHLYKKDSDNIYSLVDSIVSPRPQANEFFGSSIQFFSSSSSSIDQLIVGAPGSNSFYKFTFGAVAEATSAYNPVGSIGGIISLTSTAGILPGMAVNGLGFTSDQTVLLVLNDTQVELNGSPNSTPSGVLTFSVVGWFFTEYSQSTSYSIPAGRNFGANIVVSGDCSSAFALSSINGINLSKVAVKHTNILSQTITGTSIAFGTSLALSNDGTYLAISDPLASSVKINQGAVYIYKLVGNLYTLYQTIVNHDPENSGYFGQKISFMSDKTLVVYSSNGDTTQSMTFDTNQTTFDKKSTTFITTHIDSGKIDIYDNYSSNWVYSETLSSSNVVSDGYGTGLAVGKDHVIVGAPLSLDQGLTSGRVYDYYKSSNSFTWKKTHSEIIKPDISKVKRAFLYNRKTGHLVAHLDTLDPLQGKVAGPAKEEITFNSFYDPAVYSVGDSSVVVNSNKPWTKDQVGKLWWDLRTTKFIEAYDSDIVYRTSSFNSLAVGASVDVYEWVSTTYLPVDWDALADTEEGLTKGISGISLYGNTAYSVSQVYDTISQTFRNTYYFWVKNKKIIPNIPGRYMSASDAATLIENPRGQGYRYLSLTGIDSFNLVNVKPILKGDDVVLSVEYWITDKIDQNVHSHWKIISNDKNTTLPNNIERKWIDSLCGKDINGLPVPDLKQPVKLRYGIENRPRQSMFVNRFEALKQFVELSNIVLSDNQIVQSRNITALESYDAYPDYATLVDGTKTLPSGAYDTTVDYVSLSLLELSYVSVSAFKRPNISPVIVDGKITGITINYPGIGYLYPPFIEIVGSGKRAVIRAKINLIGQIVGADILDSGEGYNSYTSAIVRDYSVLAYSDEQSNGAWAIYSYDPTGKVWSRVKSKTYDVRNYWKKIDWYATGFDQFSSADHGVDTFSDLSLINSSIDQLVLVRNTTTSGWQLLLKYANSTSIDWTQSYKVVGVQDGTIQLSSNLYQFANTSIGYDDSTFDGAVFDGEASNELRIILNSLKNDIFIDDLKNNYLDLFFSSVRYALSEQTYLDWIFKTSFVKAMHNVGDLGQPVTYQTDNLSNFKEYVAEVKPFRTKVREYISAYSKVDLAETLVSDFDLPSVREGSKLVPINTYILNGKIQADNPAIQTYPWKNWLDNVGFIVTELRLVNGGSGYITEPIVKITSNSGSGATARAFLANGKVNRVVLLTNGIGYLAAPTVTIEGGLSAAGVKATAVAVIGNSISSDQPHGVVRSTLVKIKFDRLTQSYFITQLQQTETFVGSGAKVQFPLTWAPDIRIGQSTVTITAPGQTSEILVLRDLYTLNVVKSTSKGFTSYSGSITFTTAPANFSVIKVTYLKDWDLLNAADRTQFYYDPQTGQLGNDLSQLMTGIDYGGVVVNGLGFDVAAGWGALPYYTDKWDTFDATYSDYIVTVAAGTHSFTLPYTPQSGTILNTYYSRKNTLTYTSNGIDLKYSYTAVNRTPVVTASIAQTALASTLTSGTAGTKILKVNSTTKIKVGDIVTCSSVASFALNTIVTTINSSDTVTLNQILYLNIPTGTSITFTRTLSQPTDLSIFANGNIILTSPLLTGTNLNIITQLEPIRLDDPQYGTLQQTNTNAIMTSVTASGSSAIFTIPNTFTVTEGDQFIWRQSTSDGSIKPQDTDYDTALSGGNLAYSTATGLSADDILVDGDGLVTPTTSPAPEEVVPGQVVDAVAIKVYDQLQSGSANIKVDNYIADGTTSSFKITQVPSSIRAVIVKIGQTIKTYATDYTVDFAKQTVNFVSAPATNATVSIFSLGFNGTNILDLDYFIADGSTLEFITKSPWLDPVTSLVYLDGIAVSPELFKTDNTYVSANRIGLRFSTPPTNGKLINYIIVSGNQQTFAITKTERIIPTGTDTYVLSYPIGNSLPLESNMIVRVDQQILSGPNNNYFIITDKLLSYTIDPTTFLPYSVPITDIKVLADGNLLSIGSDYTVDLSGITITINQNVYTLYEGMNLIISIVTDQEYTYNATTKQIKFNQAYDNTHIIEVISSYKHDVLEIERTDVNVSSSLVLTPDSVQYFYYKSITGGILNINRSVINDSYVWVIKNGRLLTPAIDYKLNDDRKTITLSTDNVLTDQITLMTYGSNVLVSGIAYMQFKDMLNRVHFKRLNLNKETQLTNDLHYNDISITVDDASKFDAPNPSQNKPGIIEIRGERIEFFAITGNTLSKLRRGTLGTGTPLIHRAGSWVQEIGASETIPYVENTITEQIISDGTNFVGTTFIPTLDTNSYSTWFSEYGYVFKDSYSPITTYNVKDAVIYNGLYYINTKSSTNKIPTNTTYWKQFALSIPVGYGQSNDIEVFVGGYDTSASWSANTTYAIDAIVTVGSYTYKCITAHTSSTIFLNDNIYWSFFIGNIRLKKKPYKVHNINQAPYSPNGDIQLDADFAVDGTSKRIRLTNKLAVGTQVTVVKRQGIEWDSTVNVLNDNGNITKFLRAVPGTWYKDFKQISTSSTATTFDNNTSFDGITITFDQG